MKINSITIEGKKITVFDNLFTAEDLDALARRFYNAPFNKTEIARPDTGGYPHWAHEFSIEQLQDELFWKRSAQALTQIGELTKWRPYRAYVNYAGFGDTMFSHVDATTEEMTCLIFAMPQWQIDWAGETIFYDSQDEAAFTCVPRPGRIVLFDGRLKHAGRPPARVCYHSRFTIAIKLEKA